MANNDLISEIFGEPISVYTDEQAIADGVLHHLWEDRWPWLLVTNTVFVEGEREADSRGVDHVDKVLVPLAMDAIMEVQRVMKANPRADLVELEHTAVGTVWIRPNAKGGMTIMKPPQRERRNDHHETGGQLI